MLVWGRRRVRGRYSVDHGDAGRLPLVLGIDHSLIVEAVEVAKGLGEDVPQLVDPRGNGGFPVLQLGDVVLEPVQLSLCGLALSLDLGLGALLGLLQQLAGLALGLLALEGGERIGILAGGLGLFNQLLGLLLRSEERRVG